MSTAIVDDTATSKTESPLTKGTGFRTLEQGNRLDDQVQSRTTSVRRPLSLEHRVLRGLGVGLVVLLMAGGLSDLFGAATASEGPHSLIRAAFALTLGPFMLLHCFRPTHGSLRERG